MENKHLPCGHQCAKPVETESFYHLLTQLCKSELKTRKSGHTLKRIRSLCFGILLKKMPNVFDHSIVQAPWYDTIASLASWQLELPAPESQRLVECINHLKSLSCQCSNGQVEAVIRFILALANSVPAAKQDLFQFKPGQLDAFFTDHKNPRAYPVYDPRLFALPPPVEKFVATSHGINCPYLPPSGWFPFNEPPDSSKGISKFFQHDQPREKCSYKAMPYELPEFPELKDARELEPFKLFTKMDHSPDEGYGTPATETPHTVVGGMVPASHPQDLSNIWAHVLDVPLDEPFFMHRTWEALGSRLPPTEKPFFFEKLDAIHRLWLLIMCRYAVHGSIDMQKVADINVMREELLVHHIRYLLDGIPSETFPFDKDLFSFTTAPGICLIGVCPDAMQNFLNDFVMCGSLIHKLRLLTDTPPDDFGLVYKALCMCARDYLWLYQGALLKRQFNQDGLLTLAHAVRKNLLPQLKCIANTLSQSMLTTSDLLSLVHDAAVRVAYPTTAPLLVAMLHAGATVYLRFIEQWMFEGKLDDYQKEFFVCANPAMALSRTRRYWVAAFYLNKTSVPTFLYGLENTILDCGRGVNLLRLCSPKNPLFQELEAGFPHLRLCGSLKQLQVLERECSKFEKRVGAACGLTGSCTVGDLLSRSHSVKSDLIRIAAETRCRQEGIRNAEIESSRLREAEDKNSRFLELQAQLTAAQERKLENRRLELAEEIKLKEQQKHQEKEENKLKELEKQRVRNFYEELSRMVDRRKQRAEWRIKRMKFNEKRKELFLHDPLCLMEVTELNSKPKECQYFEVVEPDTTEKIKNFEITSVVGDIDQLASSHNINAELISSADITDDNLKNKNILESVDNVPSPKKQIHETCLEEKVMTDAQRNRIRMLQCEFGIIVSDPYDLRNSELAVTNVSNQNFPLTLVEKNRNRMMQGSYNIITGEKNKNFQDNDTATTQNGNVDVCQDILSLHDELNDNVIDKNIDFNANTNSSHQNNGVFLILENTDTHINHDNFPIEAQKDLTVDKMTVSTPNSLDAVLNELNINKMKNEDENFILTHSAATHTSKGPLDDNDIVSDADDSKGTNATNVLTADIDDTVLLSSQDGDDVKDSGVDETLLITETRENYGLNAFSAFHNSYCFEAIPIPSSPVHEVMNHFLHNCVRKDFDLTLEECSSDIDADSLQRSVLLPLQIQARLVHGALLQYFLEEELLLQHFESLRSYFLLQDGEFSQLLSTQLFQGMYEGSQSSFSFNKFSLDTILNRALSGSSHAERDPNASRLSFSLIDSTSCHFSRTFPDVFSSLVLRYSVQWPLCLILPEAALSHYNSVFGFLLKVRRVSWVLEQNFKVLRLPAQYSREENHRINLCHHAMIQFIRGLQNYIMSTVLQANWAEFESMLETAATLDDLYHFHARYLKRILWKCLLYKKTKSVMEGLTQVFSLILKFCEKVQSGLQMDTLLETYSHYQKSVLRWLQIVSRLSDAGFQPYLAQLVLSLNVSGYYNIK